MGQIYADVVPRCIREHYTAATWQVFTIDNHQNSSFITVYSASLEDLGLQ